MGIWPRWMGAVFVTLLCDQFLDAGASSRGLLLFC